MFSIRSAVVAPLIIVLLLVPSSRAAEQLPQQLSDDAFWGLVERSSEPDGSFISENFLSNEEGFQYVIPPLLQRVKPGGVYVGVGPEQNFTYVAALHSKIAFIIDIRRQNLIEHLLYKAAFELAPNRAGFLSLLFCRKPKAALTSDTPVEELFKAFDETQQDPAIYPKNLQIIKDQLRKVHKFRLTEEDEASLDHVYNTFAVQGTNLGYVVDKAMRDGVVYPINNGTTPYQIFNVPEGPIENRDGNSFRFPIVPQIMTVIQAPMTFPTYAKLVQATDGQGKNWSFLADESNYQTVREMERHNLIVPIVGDFAGPKAIRAVGQYLKEHESAVSVFYLSNVEQYLSPPDVLRSFYSNVAELPLTSESTFIRSAQGAGTQPGVAQSSLSSMQEVLEAVMDGRVQYQRDILRLFN